MMKQRKISASINDLPEVILLHIISFLPFIDAVKSSAIARSWRNLWHSIPTLNFNIETFRSKMAQKPIQEVNELFSDLISDTLRHRPEHLSLHKFKLVSLGDEDTGFGSWFRLVIAAKVFELDLDFFSFSFHQFLRETEPKKYGLLHKPFNFESTLFFELVNSSVQVLKLKGLQFRFPTVSLRLESIREVELMHFTCTEKEIADFIASCVHLESLSLARSKGLKNLRIVSQKLRYLKLHWVDEYWESEFSVEICAPSLISFDLSDYYAAKFAMTRSSSLVEAKVVMLFKSKVEPLDDVMSCLTGIERLTIQHRWPYYPSQLQPKGVSSEAIVFHNLKHLELRIEFSTDDVVGLESLLKQCPQLTTMVLVNNHTGVSIFQHFPKAIPKVDVIFQMPRLRLVEIKAFEKTKLIMYIVDLLKKHGVVLEKIVAYPHPARGKSPKPPFDL